MPPKEIVDGFHRAYWSPQDRAWVGVCAHYTDLHHIAKSAKDAMRGIKHLCGHVDSILCGKARPLHPLKAERRLEV